jgi:hypothetical protein
MVWRRKVEGKRWKRRRRTKGRVLKLKKSVDKSWESNKIKVKVTL